MDNVYVVLAGKDPVIFAREEDAERYSDLSGNEGVIPCAVRSQEDAAEFFAEYEEYGE